MGNSRHRRRRKEWQERELQEEGQTKRWEGELGITGTQNEEKRGHGNTEDKRE